MIRSMKVLLGIATIFLVACAAKPAVVADTAGADTQSAADRRFSEEARSYKHVERNGNDYYCRSERPSGSNLRMQVCWTEAELRQRIEDAEVYRRKYKPSVCAPNDPRCGGA